MSILISAFVLGILGSFHCAGMCGPIAIALPLHGNTAGGKILGGALYNLGRILTYGLMGVLFGLFGRGMALLGFQQKISVIMGSLMIISVLFPALFRNQYSMSKSSSALVGKLKSAIGRMFNIHSYQSLFFIGMLNGLLPCGLVYMAIAGAIGTGSVSRGSLYMILFGLGTIPMLLGISMAGNLVSLAVRRHIHRLIPILVVLVGTFFILRGLSLGIPYLSPPKEKIEKKFENSLEEQPISRTLILKQKSRSFLT